MKKVRTLAAKQSRNNSQQKLTFGLDLGDRNSWYCVLDESPQIQLEQRVRTNGKALQVAEGIPERLEHRQFAHYRDVQQVSLSMLRVVKV